MTEDFLAVYQITKKIMCTSNHTYFFYDLIMVSAPEKRTIISLEPFSERKGVMVNKPNMLVGGAIEVVHGRNSQVYISLIPSSSFLVSYNLTALLSKLIDSVRCFPPSTLVLNFGMMLYNGGKSSREYLNDL